jgi:transcriptional regulator with XRE-family HTH domain
MLDKALKTIREVHRYKQAELAKMLGISKSYLSEIENGQKTTVSLELLNKYSEVFDVPPSTFLSFMESLQGESQARRQRAEKLLKVLAWAVDEDGESAKAGD